MSIIAFARDVVQVACDRQGRNAPECDPENAYGFNRCGTRQ